MFPFFYYAIVLRYYYTITTVTITLDTLDTPDTPEIVPKVVPVLT